MTTNCRHYESLHGRCTACGMTWAEQAKVHENSRPMPDRTVTTSTGTTVTVTQRDDDTIVLLDHPAAPSDMRNTEAGRVVEGAFQTAPFASWALTPPTLRALADLIEEADSDA